MAQHLVRGVQMNLNAGLRLFYFFVALFLVSNWSGEKNYCARERKNKKSSFRFIEMLRAEEERKIHSRRLLECRLIARSRADE
jgi:hypothetical protein